MVRGLFGRTFKRMFPAAWGAVLALAVPVFFAAPSPAVTVGGSYLYNLSNFTGPLPLEWVAVAVDEGRGEIYVSDLAERSVIIFNEQGMEVFRFGDDERLGLMHDLAVLPGGDILLLSYPQHNGEAGLVRCTYRGEPQERIALTGLPPAWSDFRPDRLVLRGERLYLAAMGQMRVAVADLRGVVTAHHDLAELLKIEARDAGLGGFTVDAGGRLLFTVPVNFKVCILSPDGTLNAFGQPGSSPGKFGVVAGIAADAGGRIFVVDTLRCTVIAFGPDRDFIGEIGDRGYGPGGLIAPRGVTVAADGRLFVTQQGRGGVQVFTVSGGGVAGLRQNEAGRSS